MPRHPLPEDLLGSPEGPPLKLSLKCNQCGKSGNHEVAYAVVHPKLAECKAEGWDGVLLSRIIECRKCGAVDDYQLSPKALLALMGQALRRAGLAPGGSRVIVGISQLFDGTVARRPTQAIAHLREVAEKDPKSAEAWRRLGNTYERYGNLGEAAAAWRKAVEVDPEELEAAYSLAALAGDRGEVAEEFTFLRRALRLLPKNRELAGKHRLRMAEGFVALLEDVLDATDEPLALMAAWAGGMVRKSELMVNASSVDLRTLTEGAWERLPAFLAHADLVAVDLTPELPEDEPTLLQRMLETDSGSPLEAEPITVAPAPAGRPLRVGPNVQCPCGSGKKYKRCCGR